MGAVHKIRVGICGCTTYYHGELKGFQVQIGEIAEGELGEPMMLIVEEQVIPERGQSRAIQKIRPHFFLDVHGGVYGGKEDYAVLLCPYHLVPFVPSDTKRPPYVTPIVDYERWWTDGSRPSTQEVQGTIRELVHKIKKRMTLERWMAWLSLEPKIV